MSSVLYATDWLTESAGSRAARSLRQVGSRDDASRVDDAGERAWGARHIQGGDEGAVRSPHEAVSHPACIKISSRDGPAWVDAADEVPADPGGSNVVKVPSGARRKL